MEAVATSCSTHVECPWSMGPYSRELRNDAYPLGAPGEVPPECPRGCEPETAKGEMVGWLSLSAGNARCGVLHPLCWGTNTGTGSRLHFALCSPVSGAGQASPHPLAGNVHCGVLPLGLILCPLQLDGPGHPAECDKRLARSTHQDNPVALMQGRGYKIG